MMPFSDAEIYEAVKNNLDKVSSYVSSHGEGNPIGGAHHKHEHLQNEENTSSNKKDIAGIKGCDITLVQAVGENMKDALISLGITVKKIRKKDGVTADEAVKNFLNNNMQKEDCLRK